MAFKIAWAEYLWLEEIIYTGTKLKKASFSKTKITRSNNSFAKDNQYTVFHLKQSKINTKYTRMQIVLTATSEKICLIVTLAHWYTSNSQQQNVLLFYFLFGPFLYYSVVSALKKLISFTGLIQPDYLYHWFWKSIAQHLVDYGILDKMIQKLDHWNYNAFWLYFKILPKFLYNPNFSLQKSMLFAVPRVVVLASPKRLLE